MNLNNRSVSFTSLLPGVSAVETEQTATFLGQTYRIQQAPLSQSTPRAELTYRGVRYTRSARPETNT